MSASRSQYDITAAENKSVGFDYQYYYFLLELLRLKDGEEIGLEVKDDIHIELPGQKLRLLQLKHSIQTSSNGTIINLTERDIDLWKTIHNWISVIQDSSQGRVRVADQVSFIDKTEFVLVSNKSIGSRNQFMQHVQKLNEDKITQEDFNTYLTNLINDTSDSDSNAELIGFMKELLGLKKTVQKAFLKNLVFQLGEDDIISRIKKEIKGYMVPLTSIDDVYNCLNSNLRDNNYFSVKTRNKIIISFDDFYTKYRSCFSGLQGLPIRRLTPILPDDYLAQVFIKQLIDIGEISSTDKNEIIEYTKLKLLMYNNLELWIQKGELTEVQKRTFIDNCIIQWKNLFKAAHRDNMRQLKGGKKLSDIDDAILNAGLRCLDEIRRIVLSIEGQQLDIDISNGQFYLLSDDLSIGWHLDWENLYKATGND